MKPSFDDLKGKVIIITGGAGVIGSSLAEMLGWLGAKVVILDIDETSASKVAGEVQSKTGSPCMGVSANVLDKVSLEAAREKIHKSVGPIDILINGAGGNNSSATTKTEFADPQSGVSWEDTFYGLEIEGFRKVFDLNFLGTLLPTMILTTDMRERRKGVVLNISSMSAIRPLTKIPAYSAAKASVSNFTQWLAVHLARSGIRVNAIAPGFLLTSQNRFLLTDEKTGTLTSRGNKITSGTPMGRFGEPGELGGAVAFLLSDMSAFITGVVLPIDGGFNAYCGV